MADTNKEKRINQNLTSLGQLIVKIVTGVLVKRDPLQSLMIGLARAGVRRESSP